MKISLEWLNEYVDLSDITVEQIVHELTMSGLEVEDIEKIGPKFSNIVTAKILKIDNHPNADKLHLVTIDTTGSSSVKVGVIDFGIMSAHSDIVGDIDVIYYAGFRKKVLRH